MGEHSKARVDHGYSASTNSYAFFVLSQPTACSITRSSTPTHDKILKFCKNAIAFVDDYPMVGLRPTSLGVAKGNTSCYTSVLDPRYAVFKNEAMHIIHRIPVRSCSPTLNKDTSLIIILVHRSLAVANPQQQHSMKYLR